MIISLGAIFFLYIVSLVVYRLYYHPLAKYPGPKLAAATRYYEAYYDLWRTGYYTFKIGELHEKYGLTCCQFDLAFVLMLTHMLFELGPIIRISPYEIHINDPDFHEKLYNHQGHWDKYDFSIKATGNSLAAHGTRDHHTHKRRRAAMNPYFSKQKIVTMEPMIHNQIDKFCQRMNEFEKSGDFVPIGLAYAALMMDVVTEYTMEGSYGNLKYKDFNADMVDCVRGIGPQWRLGKHLTWFPVVFPHIPNWIIAKIDPRSAQWHAFQKVSTP